MVYSNMWYIILLLSAKILDFHLFTFFTTIYTTGHFFDTLFK